MMAPSSRARHGEADVAVLGCGLVGLCCARELARSGARVLLAGERMTGEASSAAAGLLAPSLESDAHPWTAAALAARDQFPDLLRELEEETRIRIALNRLGILEVAVEAREVEALHGRLGNARWLDSGELREIEPALSGAYGAIHHLTDGAVDNISLLQAMRISVGSDPAVRWEHERVTGLERSSGSVVVVTERSRYLAAKVVLALGAWTPLLPGTPRTIPIEPWRGQLVTLAGTPLRHACYGARHYLVPRPGGQLLVGSTMENVGYRIGTIAAAVDTMLESAQRLCPVLRHSRELARWSGLRPVTPDLLPIIGADPADDRVIYACGHSRNGILLAPITGVAVATVAAGAELPHGLEHFSVARFETS